MNQPPDAEVPLQKNGGAPDVGHDHAPRGDVEPAVLVVRHEAVGQGERDAGPPPVELLEERVEVRQRVAVREGRETVAPDDAVHLFLGLEESFGVARHGEEEGHERAMGLGERELVSRGRHLDDRAHRLCTG